MKLWYMTATCCAAPAEIGLRMQHTTRRRDKHRPVTSHADCRDTHEPADPDLMVTLGEGTTGLSATVMINPARPKQSRMKVQTIQKNRKNPSDIPHETTEKPKVEKGITKDPVQVISEREPFFALADAAPRHPLSVWRHEPKTLFPTGGLLALIEDTNPIIYHGVPRLIVQDANHRVALGIQSPLREGDKSAGADAGAELLDGLMERVLDHPSGGQFDLNDFSNTRERLGCVPVVFLILHLITCKSGIPLNFIENLATLAHFAIVVHRHSREHAVGSKRDLQGELADRFPSGYAASCKNDEKSLQ